MTTPRHQLVDPDKPMCYHLVSRCVRRGWLCGIDKVTRRDYTHRKEWLIKRLVQLGAAFAVDVYAYAIMSSHFHLVVYYDPKAPQRWSDREVAERWLRVCPMRTKDGSRDKALEQNRIAMILSDDEQLASIRAKLGSLSLFMKLLKQPIARRANLEDDCTGHFFEQRFYSGALLTNRAVLAAMAYVDLNPVRAKIAATIAECRHTSIANRLASARVSSEFENYLRPVIFGLDESLKIPTLTLKSYVEKLEAICHPNRSKSGQEKVTKWHEQVAMLNRKQRVFGSQELVKEWCAARGWSRADLPLPV